MQKYSNYCTNSAGQTLPGITIVVTASDGMAVQLYSDDGATPRSSTLVSGDLGYFEFYAANGRYSFTESGVGVGTSTTTDILLYDPADDDREEVSVLDLMTRLQLADVRSGAMTLNMSTVFASAIATGLGVYVPRYDYLFTATLSATSGTRIRSGGGRIKVANGVNNHAIRIANDADDVLITGLRINGNKANNTGGNGISMGGTGGTKIRVNNNYIYDCSANGIYFAGTTCVGVEAIDNYVTGCVSAGITGDDTTTKFLFAHNHTWLNGTHGVGLIGIGIDGNISDNVSWDNGQGTPNADNITGYNVGNTNLVIANNISRGGLNNGIHFGGAHISYIGNKVYDATMYGIAHIASSGRNTDVTMTGNEVYRSGKANCCVNSTDRGSFVGNIFNSSTEQGYVGDDNTSLSWGVNNLHNNTLDGWKNSAASNKHTLIGMVLSGNGGDGIDIGNLTNSTINSNVSTGNTGLGINGGGTEGTNVVVGNNVRSNTGGAIAQLNVTTRVADNETGVSRVIASAAALTIPPGGSYFYITGTTNITSMTASFAERIVVLRFDDVLTFTDGNNLDIAGNFVTTFKDTITLMCDGADWHEIARSVN